MMNLSRDEEERYSRHLLLSEIGAAGQLKLKSARVLVIGAGGLGCPVLQYLAAAGVGMLGIVDHDRVDVSNLQRQVLYNFDDLGKTKATCAAEKIRRLNPLITVNEHAEMLHAGNAAELFGPYDYVVDCTDNYETRFLINDVSRFLNKPLIYGAIYKFEGQVAVFNHQGSASYRCLFPELPVAESRANCADVGVLGVLPGIIGSYQAMEVCKLILEIGEVLSNKVLHIDLLNSRSYTYQVNFKMHPIYQKMAEKGDPDPNDYTFSCSDDQLEELTPELFVEELKKGSCIIDVREEFEQPKLKGERVSIFPLSGLEEQLDQLPAADRYLLFCRSGKRSRTAAALIKQRFPERKIAHLSLGIESIQNNTSYEKLLC